MRWTRSTYCCACSWKMSVAGHELCIFSTIGDCAVTTEGMASEPAAAPAARVPPFRNFRRDTVLSSIAVIFTSSLAGRRHPPRPAVLAGRDLARDPGAAAAKARNLGEAWQ